MNRKLLAAAVAGVVAPMTAQALDIGVSGQVNRIIRFADNGNGSDVQHLDHTASRSAFRFKAEGELMAGVSAGAHIESGFASNRGASNDIDSEASGGDHGDFRFSYVYFTGGFGKVTLGHATIAGDGTMYKSHHGAWMGTEFGTDSNSGISVYYADEDEERLTYMDDGEEKGRTVGSFFTNGALGPGRDNILRYDTPSIGPVSVAVSVRKDPDEQTDHKDHKWEFGGTLAHDVGDASLIGGIVFSEDTLGLAGGIAFPQGTSVNAAWGNDDNGGRDYEVVYANVAHSWGNTSVAIQYQATSNAAGLDGQNVGLGVNQSLGSGVDVFAGFNNYTFDDATSRDIEDVNSFHIGSRVRFN